MTSRRNEPAKRSAPDPSTKQEKPPAKGTGTEAERAGGIEPAKRQAEKDWEDSAKESGD